MNFLELTGNAFGSDGTKALGEMLKENKSLKVLYLTGLGKQWKELKMKNQITKKKLKTTDNSFGPDCVQGLSEGLKVNTSLRELSIRSKEKRTNWLFWLKTILPHEQIIQLEIR